MRNKGIKALDEAESLVSRSLGEKPGEVDLKGLDGLVHFNARERADKLRWSPATKVKKPRPVIKIGDSLISSSENITVFSGQSKVGKSRLFASLISGTFPYNELLDFDFLGFNIAPNEEGRAVVYVDTEQSLFDWDKTTRRTWERLELPNAPDWFGSYNFRALSYEQRIQTLDAVLEKEAEAFDGCFMILIDGIADFCKSPNDEAESFDIVNKFETIATKYQAPIITTLHLNPGAETDKMRGHLGSQIERKAESAFTMKRNKDSGNVEIKAKVLRNAGEDVPLMEIGWDAKAHDFKYIGSISKEVRRDFKKYAPEELRKAVEDIFNNREELTGAQLRLGIKAVLNIKKTVDIAEARTWLIDVNWVDTNGKSPNSPALRYRPGKNFTTDPIPY